MMQKRDKCKPVRATVQRVDPINRELVALVGRILVTIYVPPTCAVVLRGERVKLRLIQPGDRVCVAYAEPRDTVVARAIEVECAYPSLWVSE